jgi:hypothetical protein
MPAARNRVAVIALPAVLAAALAAIELTTRSLWLDEGATVAIASQHGSALWHAMAHDGGNMLGYYALLHELIAWFGDGLAVIRLPSVVASAATAAIVAGLGLRLYDDDGRVGCAAGAIAAVSLPLVFWGQDARGYALMVTFVAASYLAFSARRPVAYALTTLLAIYMGFVAALVVPAQLVVLAVHRRRARLMLGAVGVVAIGCIPLLVLGLERGSGQLFWVPGPSLGVLDDAARTLTSAGMPPNFHATATTTVTLVIIGAALLAALALELRRARHSESALLVCSWLLVPAALALLAWLAGEPVEVARSTVILLPAVALLLAAPLHDRRLPAAVVWAGVVVVVALRALQLGPGYGVSPEPWQTAARHVVAAARQSDCVAFYPQDGRMPFGYYVDRLAPGTRLRSVLPADGWSVVRPHVEQYDAPAPSALERIERQCPTLWLVASHEGHRPGPAASVRHAVRYGALLAALSAAYPRREDRSFGWAAAIHVSRFSR